VLVLASTAYDIGRVIGYLFVPIVIGAVILFIARSQGRSNPTASAAVAPPAWYPDPYRQARLRYWDGARWTEHTAD
jgi:Protein of unknown function (DUF2510)